MAGFSHEILNIMPRHNRLIHTTCTYIKFLPHSKSVRYCCYKKVATSIDKYKLFSISILETLKTMLLVDRSSDLFYSSNV
jgi:hypothetical protein